MIEPKRGDIAICGIGHVGIICCDEPQEVTFDGNTYKTWVGEKLSPGGGPVWMSRKPIVIAFPLPDGTYLPVEDDK